MIGRLLLVVGTLAALGGCAASRQPAASSAAADPLEALLAPAPWPADATRGAPTLDTEALARRIHDLVNEVRAMRDLPSLAWAAPLVAVASAHSRDMAEHAYFGHTNLRGEDATARAERAGLDCTRLTGTYVLEGIGENLFLTHRFSEYRIFRDDGQPVYAFDWKTTDELARQAVEGWLQSRTHRANLLSPLYHAEAIGVVLGANDALFITQNFTFQKDAALADATH